MPAVFHLADVAAADALAGQRFLRVSGAQPQRPQRHAKRAADHQAVVSARTGMSSIRDLPRMTYIKGYYLMGVYTQWWYYSTVCNT